MDSHVTCLVEEFNISTVIVTHRIALAGHCVANKDRNLNRSHGALH